MRENMFKNFLLGEVTAKSAVNNMKNARKVESILGISLDSIVCDDDIMYESLLQLRLSDNLKYGHTQKALRKYYKFANGKEFPKLKKYHSVKHP